jgi:hypothetical protein
MSNDPCYPFPFPSDRLCLTRRRPFDMFIYHFLLSHPSTPVYSNDNIHLIIMSLGLIIIHSLFIMSSHIGMIMIEMIALTLSR